MVDRLRKNLSKLSDKDRDRVFTVIARIARDELHGLDVKPLKGTANSYRVRVGNFRIIFIRESSGRNIIVAFERRDEQTYRDY